MPGRRGAGARPGYQGKDRRCLACGPWPAGMWWLRAGTREHSQHQSKSDTGSTGLAFLAPQGLRDLFGIRRIAVLHFGLGVCLWGDTETPFGPGVAMGWWEQVVPTQSVPHSLHCSWSSFPESCSSSPQRGRLSSLGAVVWCVSQEGRRGLEQLRRGQEQHQGMRLSGLGDGAELNSGTCRQGFSLVLPTVLLPLRWRVSTALLSLLEALAPHWMGRHPLEHAQISPCTRAAQRSSSHAEIFSPCWKHWLVRPHCLEASRFAQWP